MHPYLAAVTGPAPSLNPVRPAPGIPGPPSGPAPASQPRHRPSVKMHRQKSLKKQVVSNSNTVTNLYIKFLYLKEVEEKQPDLDFLSQLKKNTASRNASYLRRQESVRAESELAASSNFLQTPQGGQAKITRESIVTPMASAVRPVPAMGRPKPSVKRAPEKPRVKALYDYEAADTDEIGIAEGEIFELVREGNVKSKV